MFVVVAEWNLFAITCIEFGVCSVVSRIAGVSALGARQRAHLHLTAGQPRPRARSSTQSDHDATRHNSSHISARLGGRYNYGFVIWVRRSAQYSHDDNRFTHLHCATRPSWITHNAVCRRHVAIQLPSRQQRDQCEQHQLLRPGRQPAQPTDRLHVRLSNQLRFHLPQRSHCELLFRAELGCLSGLWEQLQQ